LEAVYDDTLLVGAGSAAVSPDGKHVYAAGAGDDAEWESDALAVFSREATSGMLSCPGMQRDGQNGVGGLDGAYSVAASPDGSHVLVASDQDSAVAIFANFLSRLSAPCGQESGALTIREDQTRQGFSLD
jgi:DNA-binding beta-propeller fold protein YncE